MARASNARIKDPETYEKLRDEGASKEKAARIANAHANPDMHPFEKGGKAPPYEDWTVEELRARARELDIEGRSTLRKAGLIEALRNH